jgi:hypothetical protein
VDYYEVKISGENLESEELWNVYLHL